MRKKFKRIINYTGKQSFYELFREDIIRHGKEKYGLDLDVEIKSEFSNLKPAE